jgi:hypothetical protein
MFSVTNTKLKRTPKLEYSLKLLKNETFGTKKIIYLFSKIFENNKTFGMYNFIFQNFWKMKL